MSPSSERLRVRSPGRLRKTARRAGTLTSGDRAGSLLPMLEPGCGSTEAANAWSGSIHSAWKQRHAFVVNRLRQFGRRGVFGTRDVTVSASTSPLRRTCAARGGACTFANEALSLGSTTPARVTRRHRFRHHVNRSQVGGGWFVTPNVITTLESSADDENFPTTDIRTRKVPGLHGRGRRRRLSTTQILPGVRT